MLSLMSPGLLLPAAHAPYIPLISCYVLLSLPPGRADLVSELLL